MKKYYIMLTFVLLCNRGVASTTSVAKVPILKGNNIYLNLPEEVISRVNARIQAYQKRISGQKIPLTLGSIQQILLRLNEFNTEPVDIPMTPGNMIQVYQYILDTESIPKDKYAIGVWYALVNIPGLTKDERCSIYTGRLLALIKTEDTPIGPDSGQSKKLLELLSLLQQKTQLRSCKAVELAGVMIRLEPLQAMAAFQQTAEAAELIDLQLDLEDEIEALDLEIKELGLEIEELKK